MRNQNNVKRNVCKKISEESLPKKSNNFSINFFFVKRLYQGNSEGTFSVQKYEEKSLYQKIFQETVPCQKIWRKTSTKNSSEEKSLPKNEETSPATKLQTIMTRNKKNQNWWNQRKKCLLNFNFHSWQLFLIEISFGWAFWVEILLQILFARGFSDFGWLRSLFRYIWVEC